MKILTVVGARPQFVKAAILSRLIAKREGIEEVLVHTGQHFDSNMSDIFFDEMEIPKPDHKLSINGLSHGAMTGRMLEEIEKILLETKPDWVLVYGDTNSTLAGALAAKKLHIKVAHVEAGLRSFNMRMPEEINRILTDRISDILFCPTDTAVQNLIAEGMNTAGHQIEKVGDIMYDSVLYYSSKISERARIANQYQQNGFALCTLHRAENTDDLSRLENIVRALNLIHEEIPVILPIHPRTRNIINQLRTPVHFNTIDPLGYFDMLGMLQKCAFVLTDSGGLQKEAFFFKKFCLTLRDQTEWVELTENGLNFLVGADFDEIIRQYHSLQSRQADFSLPLYGQGNTGERIIDVLLAHHQR
ncbi:non-hydrolyzing UDP-N-acetylglucosamine 2-epimerase [Chitinophaga sp. NPDC101104]|uniref:non-hydrolyzing UDP-N-acetylglucosamine 2-epimerase n=1 Tax=Chitinophaga sp. NPDC101104 TaxID=3390561 RepID=UPI003CFC9186